MTGDMTGTAPPKVTDNRHDDVAELVAMAAAASMSPERRAAFVTSLLAGATSGDAPVSLPPGLTNELISREVFTLGGRRIDVRISTEATAPSAHVDDMGEVLAAGFRAAVGAAIGAAHADGHAVSGIEAGVAVERRPDGTKRVIEEAAEWSPTQWRHR